MKVLIIGNGGREHALAWKAKQSPLVTRVFVAPGNAGTAHEGSIENVAISATDIPALLAFAKEQRIGLTIVGPEAPLVKGVVDAFRAEGLAIFGPTAAAAQLEGSKRLPRIFWPATPSRLPSTRTSPRWSRRWPTCVRRAPPSSSRLTAWPPARGSSLP